MNVPFAILIAFLLISRSNICAFKPIQFFDGVSLRIKVLTYLDKVLSIFRHHTVFLCLVKFSKPQTLT